MSDCVSNLYQVSLFYHHTNNSITWSTGGDNSVSAMNRYGLAVAKYIAVATGTYFGHNL